MQAPIDNLLVATMAQIYPNDRQVSNGVERAISTVEYLNSKLESIKDSKNDIKNLMSFFMKNYFPKDEHLEREEE